MRVQDQGIRVSGLGLALECWFGLEGVRFRGQSFFVVSWVRDEKSARRPVG